MKEKSISATSGTDGTEWTGGSDWEWLDRANDADIDFSDIPEQGEEFFKNAVLRMPKPKKMVSIRLDEEVLVWFKHQGPGYQTKMNAVLKAYMMGVTGAKTR